MPDLIYNKEEVLKLIEAQKNNPTLDTENRGVTFLYGLANGRIGLTEDAKEIVPEYFDVLRQSRHPMIKSTLEDAEKAFNAQNTVATQEPVASDEAQTLEADIPFTGAEIERFNGLLDKDNVDITSEEYAFMADILARRLIQAEKAGEDTASILQQFAYLAGMAQDKINQVFDGDIASDEAFPDLVALLGTEEQKELLDIRTKALLDTGYQQTITDLEDVIETPTVEEPAPVVAEPEPVVEEPIVNEPEPIISEPEPVIEEPVIEPTPAVEPEPAPAVEPEPVVEEPIAPQPTPAKKEKAPKKSAKKAPAPKPAKTGELPLDAIVYNSKKLAAMNAQELLDIAQRIEEVPNEKQKRRMKSAFRYFIVQKLDNPKKVNLAEEGLSTLAQNFGTAKQRAMFETTTPQPQAVVTETITPSEPTIVILPPEDEVIVENHTEPKPEKKPEVKKKPAAEKKPEPEKKKAKEVKMDKTPWYKRYIVQAAAAVILLASTVFAVTKNVFGSDKSSDNDNAPKTEVKAKTVTQPKQDAKTADFDQVRAAQANAKQIIQAKKAVQAKKEAQAKQETKFSKEDAEYAKRTANFVKKISKMHDMTVEDVQEKVDNFVKDADLPQSVSESRMAYLATFYSLFPNSEFGNKMTQMLHGETVNVSKDEIKDLSQKHGQFGKKNIKSMETLKVMKQAKSNVK